MSPEEEKERAHHRISRAVCVVGRVMAALTMVVGVYLLATERNWYVLALGAWTAISIESLARGNWPNPEDDPSAGRTPDADGR